MQRDEMSGWRGCGGEVGEGTISLGKGASRAMSFGQDAYHCDLCSGHPQCVSVCTSEAIRVKK
jgi:ferredoxin